MKKNRFLKLASGMLILCLITTCAISTTFAKYATGGTSQDTARVAKWGVELVMEGDPIFHNEYATHDTTYAGALSVESDTQVVAPGTNSADAASSARFKLTGKPEVAVKVTIALEIAKDVYLKTGTYYDGTKAAVEVGGNKTYETFDLGADYYPVVFTLKQISGVDGVDYSPARVLKEGTLAEIQAFLANYSANAFYAPNTKLDSVFELSWAWAFDSNDAADTLLGNLAAGTIPTDLAVDEANYCLDVNYKLTITVEQID